MSKQGNRSMPSGGSPYSRSTDSRGFYSNPEAGAASGERLVDKAIDPDSHNLHAGVGERCMICNQVIRTGRPVRRTISGGYVHDSC